MDVKGVVVEDFVNYRKCSLFIGFPKCSFKCCIEAGCDVCQNSALATSKTISVDPLYLVSEFKNSICEAIVCGGLEPFDTFDDLCFLIETFRNNEINNEFIIYTGYNENEIDNYIRIIRDRFQNIIVKFGRFIPNSTARYDEILGITLASDNQYAVKIS